MSYKFQNQFSENFSENLLSNLLENFWQKLEKHNKSKKHLTLNTVLLNDQNYLLFFYF